LAVEPFVTDESRYLVKLAQRIADAYLAAAAPDAILLTGSAATGDSDEYSDLDLIVYYDRLPLPEHLAAARATLQPSDSRVIASDEDGSTIEELTLQGVTCQVAHLSLTAWERDMASVLEEHTPATVVEKAIGGLLEGMPLHGADVIAGWRAGAAVYPDALARATVEHYLRFFPLWLIGERWQARDATLFYYESLVDTSLNLVGVLAGLNRRYFSRFQFKRLHQFVAAMAWVPERFADRLDGLFRLDPVTAGIAMEQLVAETLALVEAQMPGVSTAPAGRHLGARPQPWTLPAGERTPSNHGPPNAGR
jgi:hypothetical protein